MILYILLPIATLLTGLFMRKLKYRGLFYSIIWGFLLFFIAAIRKYTGHDYVLYENWYHEFRLHTIDSMTYSFRQEKGFTIPLKVMGDYGVDPQIVFALIAFLIASLLALFIYRHSKNAPISFTSFILFGFYFNSLNFMRQVIAALIICYAFHYIKANRPFRYLSIVLLASVFHISALMMIPFYFILKIKMNKISMPVFILASVVLWIYSEPILEFITRYFYKEYGNIMDNIHMAQGLPVTFTLLYGIFAVIVFVLQKYLVNEKNKNHIYITAMFLGVFFEFIGIKHSVVSRLGLYFLIPSTVVLSAQLFVKVKELYIKNFGEDKKKLYLISSASIAAVLIFFGTLYGFLLYSDNNGVVPYNTVFSKLSFEEFAHLRDGGGAAL